MQMSDAEILSSYHGAKDPEKQIGVLEDLNAVKSDEMRQYLHKLGAPVELLKEKPHKVRKPPVANFDVSRALELHAEGLSDLDIAEQLGVKVTNFAAWRRGHMRTADFGADCSSSTVTGESIPCSKLITALKMMQIEIGGLTCRGCGYEHNCHERGCAVLRAAVEALEQQAKQK